MGTIEVQIITCVTLWLVFFLVSVMGIVMSIRQSLAEVRETANEAVRRVEAAGEELIDDIEALLDEIRPAAGKIEVKPGETKLFRHDGSEWHEVDEYRP